MIKEEEDDDNYQQLETSVSNTLETNSIIDNVVEQINIDFSSISDIFTNIENKFKEIENRVNDKIKSISEPQNLFTSSFLAPSMRFHSSHLRKRILLSLLLLFVVPLGLYLRMKFSQMI
jgi:restriction endonuclease